MSLAHHKGIARAERYRLERLSAHPKIFSVFTHMTEKERMLLFQLASGLSLNATTVEVGSYLGASTCFLAAGARSCRGRVYAVDTWRNDAMSEGSRDTYGEFIQNISPLQEWITPLRGVSTEVAAKFKDEIDLLFIDGDHTYEAVLADVEAWLPKLKRDGIVVFHDFSWADGVRRVVKEMIAPLQAEGGRTLDSIYWTRINQLPTNRQQTLRASIIVPTYGRPEYLQELLGSLLPKDLPVDQYEIVVVDNKPTGEIPRIIKDTTHELKKYIRYVEEPRVGLHNARHAGAKAARGAILVYVDDDILAEPGWLRAILEPFKDPDVAIVGGRVLPKWEAKPPGWLSQFNGGYLSLLDLGEERQELRWPGGAYGCNMAIRRAVLFEVGGFNPDAMGDRRLLWLRGDGETGLHQKVYQADYKVMYEPRACVYHRVPPNRLRPEYFYRRSFMQGISDSYTVMRETSNSEMPNLRLLRHSIRCYLKASHLWISAMRHADQRIWLKSQAWYWYGRGDHRFRIAFSKKLRRHVLKESYI